MSNRRRNIFILAFVALLIVGSGIVIATKKTTLGLDLKGGTELIFQAPSDAAEPDDRQRRHGPRDRDHPQADRRLRRVRAGDLADRLGLDPRRPARRQQRARTRASRSGETAQLYFYDWEPNVIPNPAKTNVPNGESSFSRLYDAVKLASKQTPECFQNKCTTTGPRYYLFNSQTHA